MSAGSRAVSKVVVITRTIGRPVLLRRTLESLLAQTWTDWVWAVVPLGPEEAVRPTLDAAADRLGDRVLVLPFEAALPGMRGAPLNHAIRNTDSEFITVLDDDDTWEPRFLEQMIGALECPPGPAAGGCVSQSLVIEEGAVEAGLPALRSYVLNPSLRSLTLAQLAVVNQFCIHAFVYRRSALAESELYPEDYPVLEDWYFNLRFLARHDIVVLPEVLSNYHQRPSVAAGNEANSLHAEVDLHKFYESKLINTWLREDLASGRMGLGHLLAAGACQRVLVQRLHNQEGKIRDISDKVGKIDSRTKEMKDNFKKRGWLSKLTGRR